MSSFRKERVADLVLSSLATGLLNMHDPRLTSVTVTEVKMTPDLRIAKVYFSAIGITPDAAKEALVGAKGALKKKIGSELQLRVVPDLQFYYDEAVETGSRIEALLNTIKRGAA